MVRLQPALLEALDAWNSGKDLSRPAAIRELLAHSLGLAAPRAPNLDRLYVREAWRETDDQSNAEAVADVAASAAEFALRVLPVLVAKAQGKRLTGDQKRAFAIRDLERLQSWGGPSGLIAMIVADLVAEAAVLKSLAKSPQPLLASSLPATEQLLDRVRAAASIIAEAARMPADRARDLFAVVDAGSASRAATRAMLEAKGLSALLPKRPAGRPAGRKRKYDSYAIAAILAVDQRAIGLSSAMKKAAGGGLGCPACPDPGAAIGKISDAVGRLYPNHPAYAAYKAANRTRGYRRRGS